MVKRKSTIRNASQFRVIRNFANKARQDRLCSSIIAAADLPNGEFIRLDASIVTGDGAEHLRRRIASDVVEISEEVFRKLAWPLDECVCDSEPAEADRLEGIEAEYLTPPERGSW